MDYIWEIKEKKQKTAASSANHVRQELGEERINVLVVDVNFFLRTFHLMGFMGEHFLFISKDDLLLQESPSTPVISRNDRTDMFRGWE